MDRVNTDPKPFLIGSIDFSLPDYKRLISIDETLRVTFSEDPTW
jgi:hypothetical protein